MKWNIKNILFLCCFTAGITSCENGDIEFDDFEYQTVYFSQQTPIRTITLGDDVYDRTLDNEHCFEVYVTLGGVWKNRIDRVIGVVVDNSLCTNKKYADGTEVTPLPENYYQLGSNNITIPAGQIMGAVKVQLTDAFFADPKATSLHYVLPLRIVTSNDSILEGKDYTLYALNYKNKYHGCWISHGTDEINTNGVITTVVREAEYLEKNELRYLTTLGLGVSSYAVETVVDANDTKETLHCNLILTFDANDNCTITTTSENCSVSGSGKWERQGAKKAWGDKDRDQLTLNYTLTYNYTDKGQACYQTYKSNDILVMRDRESKFETFSMSE